MRQIDRARSWAADRLIDLAFRLDPERVLAIEAQLRHLQSDLDMARGELLKPRSPIRDPAHPEAPTVDLDTDIVPLVELPQATDRPAGEENQWPNGDAQ